MRLLCVLLAVLLLFVAAGEAFAAVRAVPAEYATVQQAVDAAGDGDVIEIARGPYSEDVIVSGFDRLEIRGREDAIVRSFAFQDCTNILLLDLQVGPGPGDGLYFLRCRDCRVYKCAVVGVDGIGILMNDAERVTIERVRVEDAEEAGIRALTGCDEIVVLKCSVENTGDVGIGLSFEGGSSGVPNSRVEKNEVSRVDGAGIVAGGDNNIVVKNHVSLVGGDGIAIDGSTDSSNVLISQNSVEDCGGAGYSVQWSGNTLVKNSVARCGYAGIFVGGSAHFIEGNKVSEASKFGVSLEGPNSTVRKNKVATTGSDGFYMNGAADGCTIEMNSVKGAGSDGFFVHSGAAGNTIVRNKAKDSADFDLRDESAPGSNTWDRNNFKTIAPTVP